MHISFGFDDNHSLYSHACCHVCVGGFVIDAKWGHVQELQAYNWGYAENGYIPLTL